MDKYRYKAIPWAYVKSTMCTNEAFLLKCIMETDCYLINYEGSTQGFEHHSASPDNLKTTSFKEQL